MSHVMCDATCRRCGHRVGWAGEPKDQPPCHRCGAGPDRGAIAADQAKFDALREAASATGPETASGRTEAVWIQDWGPGTYVYAARRHPAFPSEPGTFGNPFSAGPRSRAPVRVGSVEEAVAWYRRWLEGDAAAAALLPPAEEARRLAIVAALPSLRGRRLACFRHDGPCHAQALAELADGPMGEPRPGGGG